MRLVQRDDQPVELPGGVAQGAPVHALRESIRDHPGERLRRGVHAREGRLVVEVAVVELGQDGVQLLGRSADVDDDAVGVEVARRNVASTTYVAPWSRCAGPNTSPRRLWATIMWSRTVTLNTVYPSP